MAVEALAIDFAGHLITSLADRVVTLVQSQIEYQTGAKAQLETLRQDLTKIQAAIYSACMLQVKNPALQHWLKELTEAAEAAEGVLTKSPDTYKPRPSVRRFFFQDRDLNELNDVVKRFQKIVTQMGDFLKEVELDLRARKHREMLGWQQTTSMEIESEIIGREKERDDMVIFLLATEGNNYVCGNYENFAVISIIGIQGIGKTTLARSVYNDRNVQEHFDIKVWLCVSEELNVKRLMIEIIESACIHRPHDLHGLINLDTIQRILKQVLVDKRFLIVFDDIRSDQIIAGWKSLWPSFKFGKKGSRIILTTCDQNVGEMMQMETINLKSLEDEEYWRLLKRWAYGGVNPTDLPTKEFCGRHIAPKLGESPLAARMVGRGIASVLSEGRGQKMMQSKI